MALLTAAEVKQLVPKSREIVSDTSLQVYIDSAEQRILRFLRGAADGDGLTRDVETDGWHHELRLGRPLRNGAKTDVTSITRVDETPETIAASSWFVLRPHTLRRAACWPAGVLRVVYNAVDKTVEAKEAQAHLVGIALIADGLASIEDGEFSERRLQGVGSESDMISRAERRILGKLLSGADMV